MAGADNIRAGGAYVEIGAEQKGLERGLAKAEARFKKFGDGVEKMAKRSALAFAALSTAIVGVGKAFASFGDDHAKASRRVGVSVTDFSELAHVMEISGGNAATLETGFRGLQRAIFDATRGSKEIVDSFAMLGVTAEQLSGMSIADSFELMAAKIGEMDNASLRGGVAMKIFGRAGLAMLPMFDLGAKGISDLRQEARDLGISLSSETAEAAEYLTDQLLRMKRSMTGIVVTIGSQLEPELSSLADKFIETAKSTRAFIDENPRLAEGALVGVGALGAISLALTSLAVVLKSSSVVYGAFAAVVASPLVVPALGIISALAATIAGMDIVLKMTGTTWGDFWDMIKRVPAEAALIVQESVAAIDKAIVAVMERTHVLSGVEATAARADIDKGLQETRRLLLGQDAQPKPDSKKKKILAGLQMEMLMAAWGVDEKGKKKAETESAEESKKIEKEQKIRQQETPSLPAFDLPGLPDGPRNESAVRIATGAVSSRMVLGSGQQVQQRQLGVLEQIRDGIDEMKNGSATVPVWG